VPKKERKVKTGLLGRKKRKENTNYRRDNRWDLDFRPSLKPVVQSYISFEKAHKEKKRKGY